MKPIILWDLDGTLTNPASGIVGSIQYALEKSGRPVPKFDDLLWVIGPPIQIIFSKLAPEADEKTIWNLIAKYRECYGEKGMFENEVYPGIPDLLKTFADRKMFVCTSKPYFFASQILDHFDLTKHFRQVFGAELDGRLSNKGELIQHILKTHDLDPTQTVIIGDREHDVFGAKAAGISSIGITWGFGSREELTLAGADQIVDSIADLTKVLQAN